MNPLVDSTAAGPAAPGVASIGDSHHHSVMPVIRDDRRSGTDGGAAFDQSRFLQLSGEPVRQGLVPHPAGIDLRHRHLLLAKRDKDADPVGEPQMRVGQRPQLVLVVLERLVIAGLAYLEGDKVVGDRALVHHDVGVNRFSEMIVGRDDGAVRQPQRAIAEPVVVAVDFPARELFFDMDGEPVRQRALAEILFEQKGLARVEFMECGDDLVEFGLHDASTSGDGRCYICTSISRGPGSAMASASALLKSSTLATERPGTPMPLASATKSRSGRLIFSMSSARCPGSPAPTPSNSPRRIW